MGNTQNNPKYHLDISGRDASVKVHQTDTKVLAFKKAMEKAEEMTIVMFMMSHLSLEVKLGMPTSDPPSKG